MRKLIALIIAGLVACGTAQARTASLAPDLSGSLSPTTARQADNMTVGGAKLSSTLSAVNVTAYHIPTDANWGSAFTLANTQAESLGVPLYCPPAQYDVGNTTFTINMAKTGWFTDSGAQCRLLWSTSPTDKAINIVSTGLTYSSRYKNLKTVLNGVTLLGGGQYSLHNASGILLSGTSTGNVSFATFENTHVQGFSTHLEYTDNVWNILFKNSSFLWGALVTPSTASNFGEGLTFDHTFFADGTTITLNRGEWHFVNGTSIDNTKLVINNDAFADVTASHMEDPGRTGDGDYFADISSEGRLYLNGTTVLSNAGTPARTVPLFNVHTTANTDGGLYIDGAVFSLRPDTDYNTLTLANQQSFVTGTGKVSVSKTRMTSLSSAQFVHFGYGSNSLANGSFEGSGSGATTGWIATTGGGTSTRTFTASTVDKQIGSYSGANTVVYGSGAAGAQYVRSNFVPCKGGDSLVGGVWFKRNMATATGASSTVIGLAAYDAAIVQVSGSNLTFSTNANLTDDAWTYKRLGGTVPTGSAWCAITTTVTAAGGTALMYIDDAVLTVVHNGT